jgi:prephenate dehydrogenase
MAEYNHSALLRSLYTYQQSLQEVIGFVESQQWEQLEAFLTNTQSDRNLYL